jgi:hypothetical protein
LSKTSEIKKQVDAAIAVVKDYDEPYRTKAFEVILSKSIESLFPEKSGEGVSPESHGRKQGKKRSSKPAQTVVPIPLDLKGKDNKPSLREFYKQKSPSRKNEAITVFAYYLKEYLSIPQMEAGHVASCCKEVSIKVPRSIQQMFYDIHRTSGWLNIGDGRKYAEINTAGENLVIHDLPRKKDVT